MNTHMETLLKVEKLTLKLRNRQDYTVRYILPGGIWSYTFYYETTSISGNKCPQMFCTPPIFVDVCPMKKKGEKGYVLIYFIN